MGLNNRCFVEVFGMVGVVKMCLLPKIKINIQKIQINNLKGLESNLDREHQCFF